MNTVPADSKPSIAALRPSHIFSSSDEFSWAKRELIKAEVTLAEAAQRIILGKMQADSHVRVDDGRIHVGSTGFSGLEKDDVWDRVRETHAAVRADVWEGAYCQFDLVTQTWPVVPARLFDSLHDDEGKPMTTSRARVLHHYSNGMTAIPALDPLLIHPRLGIYRVKRDYISEQPPASCVYRFDEIANNFWLLELRRHTVEGGPRLVLFAFISPRPLNARENADLVPREAEDPDYAKGVREGWSVLFLGEKDVNSICVPGRVDRSVLIARIPAAFWSAHATTDFRFLDDQQMRDPASA